MVAQPAVDVVVVSVTPDKTNQTAMFDVAAAKAGKAAQRRCTAPQRAKTTGQPDVGNLYVRGMVQDPSSTSI